MKALLSTSFLITSISTLHASPCRDKVARELDASRLRAGDLVFISSTSGQSDLLRVATRSTWTHVGLLVTTGRGEGLAVYEASATTRMTPLKSFIAMSRDQQVSIKRVNAARCEAQRSTDPDIDCAFTRDPDRSAFMAGAAGAIRRYMGKPYDDRFLPGDDEIYCSELVQKVYLQGQSRLKIGEEASFGQVLGLRDGEDWRGLKDDPARRVIYDAILRRFIDRGFDFDPAVPVVTPKSQYESPLLEAVYECATPTG